MKKELSEEIENYPLCSRCVHWQGCHSTVFGECWTCNKNVKGDVEDNDWHYENEEPIVPCEHYTFGEPDNHYVG